MTFAEDKTYEYIRYHHKQFRHIRAREILPYLGCLTTSDQDRLHAELDRWGNADSLWKLFDSLRRRKGWVESLIQALRDCEHTQLAEEVAHVYQSNLPPLVSGPAVDVGGPSNGYQEEEPSYPTPVQDTQSPQCLGQTAKTATQTHSSGTVQPGTGDQEPLSHMADRRPPTTRGQPPEQDKEQGSLHSAGGNPTPLRGPVSPTVSFQPLNRSTSRASRLPAPPVSGAGLSPTSPGLILTGAPGDQAEATIWSGGIGVPTNSPPTSPVPSKVPINPKPKDTVPIAVPSNPTPSKLPVNPARAGTGAPKVPAPDHRMPTSAVPSRGPALKVPSSKGGNKAAEGLPVPPARTGTEAGSVPRPAGSAHWNSSVELSKPGTLVSHLDSPFSGCSEDLAISSSDSLGNVDAGHHGPEENEYQSGSITVHVAESPSADLMASNSGPSASEKPQNNEFPEEQQKPKTSWAAWVVVAVAGGLLAAFLGVLHRRHLLQ